MRKVLAWSGKSEDGDAVKVFLFTGEVLGELEVTLAGGTVWRTELGLAEIAIFHSRKASFMSLYMDEMIRNAKAASVLVH